jgi:hypothetical protein
MEKGSTKEDAARSFFKMGRSPELLFIAALFRSRGFRFSDGNGVA